VSSHLFTSTRGDTIVEGVTLKQIYAYVKRNAVYTDPDAQAQNVCCAIEKEMGIYPNIERLVESHFTDALPDGVYILEGFKEKPTLVFLETNPDNIRYVISLGYGKIPVSKLEGNLVFKTAAVVPPIY
jgi:hypothetical protein